MSVGQSNMSVFQCASKQVKHTFPRIHLFHFIIFLLFFIHMVHFVTRGFLLCRDRSIATGGQFLLRHGHLMLARNPPNLDCLYPCFQGLTRARIRWDYYSFKLLVLGEPSSLWKGFAGSSMKINKMAQPLIV